MRLVADNFRPPVMAAVAHAHAVKHAVLKLGCRGDVGMAPHQTEATAPARDGRVSAGRGMEQGGCDGGRIHG